MNTNQIWIMGLLLGFIGEVWASISELEGGLVFLSFIFMLTAIYMLFLAYEALRDSLTKKLAASK